MKHNNAVFSILVVSLGLGLMTRCLPKLPSDEDVVGVWIQNDAITGKEGTSLACIKFMSDGNFEVYNFPEHLLVSIAPTTQLIDSSGTWKLEASNGDPFANHEIIVEFNYGNVYKSGYNSILYISTIGPKPSLFTGVEEDDIYFQKYADMENCK